MTISWRANLQMASAASTSAPASWSNFFVDKCSKSDLIGVLEEEAGVALTWLKQNQMIANPEKFHALLIKKDKTNTCGENISIQGKMIKSEETVKLLGIQLDYKLNFEQHISQLC